MHLYMRDKRIFIIVKKSYLENILLNLQIDPNKISKITKL
jgi:hypothetical protein